MEERPLQCCECKKPLAVRYTEIVGKEITKSVMCNDCPELQKKLHGIELENQENASQKEKAGLACGNCDTTLNEFKTGQPLGCSTCYEIFDQVLIEELLASKSIPGRLSQRKSSMPLHIGRIPGEHKEINPSAKLMALNDALHETLQREDYEQAAWLRDQIKEITEKEGGKT